MPAITDTIKVKIMLAILSLLSAGENRSLFIMPEFYNGVNDYGCGFACGIVLYLFKFITHVHSL